MLAKELKIKTMKKQREFIQQQLSNVDTRDDGDTAYRYVGHIYPEVIKHFESEGFVVTQVNSELLSAMFKGLPVYVFTVGDIKLSEEELKQAEAYEPKKNEEDSDDDWTDFLKGIWDEG